MSLLLSKAISEQFIYFLASTFEPNGSSSSTDENQQKTILGRNRLGFIVQGYLAAVNLGGVDTKEREAIKKE